MKFEKLWKRCLNDEIVENYDLIKEVFNEEIEAEIREEYSIADILIDFINYNEEAKKFERILEFTEILKTKNSLCFKEVFPFYDEFLIDYYCYHKEKNKLEEALRNFSEFPLEDYDLLLKSLRKLILYGHTDLGDHLIENIYTKIANSPELIDGAEFDLAVLKYQITLEKTYDYFINNGKFDWDFYKDTLTKFDFHVENKWIELVEDGFRGLPTEIMENFPNEFSNHRREAMEKLEKSFMKYMRGRKVNFPTSGSIWNYMYEFWEQDPKKKNPQRYFEVKEKEFKEFLRNKSGMIIDYRFTSVLILWGSSYVYDFLNSIKLIDSAAYKQSKELIKKFKTALINENLSQLWKYNFVHIWERPEMVTEEEEIREKEIFKKYHQEEETGIIKKNGFFLTSQEEFQEQISTFTTPIEKQKNKQLPKLGRNEKVTVKYTDGSIKKEVKYKKVKKDLENGDCSII